MKRMWIEYKGQLINLSAYREVESTPMDVKLLGRNGEIKILRCEDSGEVSELFQTIREICLGVRDINCDTGGGPCQ